MAVSALSMALCIFATYYFLIVLKTSIVYTQLFYIPVVLTCAWWGRKGIITALGIVVFLLGTNFFLAHNISIVDNLARSTILVTVSVITSALFVSRKKIEEKLMKSEHRWATTLVSIGDAVIATNTSEEITFLNAEAEKLTGWTLSEASHKPLKTVFKIINEYTREEVDNPISKAFETGKVVGLANHTILVNKNGTEVAIDDSAAPIRTEDGKIMGVVLVFRDISERRRAEKELSDLKDFNEGIVESISEALLVIDPKDYRIIAVNGEAERELGLREEDLVGKTCYEVTHNFSTRCEAPHDCPLKEALATGKVATANHVHFDKDQNRIYVEISVYPIRNQDGEITNVVHLARNVTERKKAEEKLLISEERVRQAQSVAHTGDWDWNVQTGVLVWGEETYRIFGFPLDMTPSVEKFLATVHPEDVEFVKQSIEDALKGKPYNIDMRINRTDGALRVTNATGEVEFDAEGKPVRMFGMFQDISERKKAEEELKMAANIFDLATDSIFVHDLEGNIVNFNEAAYKLRGYSKEEMAKMNIRDLDNPDSAAIVEPRIKMLVENSDVVFESVQLRKDKTLLPVEIHARTIDLQGKKLVLAVARDISERKKAEEALNEVMDKLVLVNEKLGVVGSLTRHDVRNKLSTVTGYAYLLKKKHSDQADIVEGLGKMEQAVKETTRIFDFAKMYEQLGAEQLTPINVEAKLNEATTLFSGQLPKIINECHGLTVLADSFLRQLFYNFIDNTRKYGQKTTTIKVHYEKTGQDSLKLIYEDNGVGVPLENKALLFKEGFSTGGSTGFGLFLAKKMMDVYGWKIEENGEPGIGAKFTITIPRLNQNGKENYQITE